MDELISLSCSLHPPLYSMMTCLEQIPSYHDRIRCTEQGRGTEACRCIWQVVVDGTHKRTLRRACAICFTSSSAILVLPTALVPEESQVTHDRRGHSLTMMHVGRWCMEALSISTQLGARVGGWCSTKCLHWNINYGAVRFDLGDETLILQHVIGYCPWSRCLSEIIITTPSSMGYKELVGRKSVGSHLTQPFERKGLVCLVDQENCGHLMALNRRRLFLFPLGARHGAVHPCFDQWFLCPSHLHHQRTEKEQTSGGESAGDMSPISIGVL